MEESPTTVKPDEQSNTSLPSTLPEAPATPNADKPAKDSKPTGKTKKTSSFSLQTFIIPLLIAFMLISGYLVYLITGVDQRNNELDVRVAKLEQPSKYASEQVENDKFQAVFLSNGQVYFGKVTHIDEGTMTLQDIYYLKSGNFKQDGTVTGALALAKLGKDEVHGPEDKMNVERQNVEFWENLKNEGQVVKAIIAFEKAQKK